MDQDDQRDPQEERYWGEFCPVCAESPCHGGKGKGSCEPEEE